MIKRMKIINAINEYHGYTEKGRFCYYIHLNLPNIGRCTYIYYCPLARMFGEDNPDDKEIKNHMLYSDINIKF